MSEKKTKQSRRELSKLIGPLQPIDERVFQEADGNPDLFAKWVAMAAAIKSINPDIPVDLLLPSQLEATVKKYNPELLK